MSRAYFYLAERNFNINEMNFPIKRYRLPEGVKIKPNE